MDRGGIRLLDEGGALKALQKKHLRRLRIGTILNLYVGLTDKERLIAHAVLREKGFDWREAKDAEKPPFREFVRKKFKASAS